MKRMISLLIIAGLLIGLTGCQKEQQIELPTIDTAPATAPVDIPEIVPTLTNHVTITCVEGSPDCYRIDGDTIFFSGLTQDSLYTISGQWNGNIVIDAGEDFKLELEMQGFSIASNLVNPITVISGDKVTLTAKNAYDNFIYDTRETVDSDEECIYAGAIHADCDLTIGGKGTLTVISMHNNGIHTKDDLVVKNLALTVSCMDNALKGNDSVTVSGGNIVLLSKQGDGIKTSNSHISEKGNQRGTISIAGCVMYIYAACDGIDAAYDVMIDDPATQLNIYTDKYSEYSETVDQTADREDLYYIRFSSEIFNYAVKYYNSDSDYQWVVAAYHSTVSGNRSNYYYYSFPALRQYSKIQYFGYTEDQTPGQEEDYAFCTDYLSINMAYDTFAIYQRGNALSYNWENYSTQINEGMGPGGHGPGGMGPGGMQEGNPDKGSYSTKGIKADNNVTILEGSIQIVSYDDAIHANNTAELENGTDPLGSVTVNGGNLILFSNDDGIHADGSLCINAGVITVTHAYEGLEGNTVSISGGEISVISSDDGINATATGGESILISGGQLYVYAGGDGIDSNSRDAYSGIVFTGGKTVVISASNGNSAIDTERGYRHTGGYVLAVTSSGGMSGETTNCQNLSNAGTKSNMKLSAGDYLSVSAGGKSVITVKMPCSVSAVVVYLGSNQAEFKSPNSISGDLDANGVCWNVS